MDVSREQIKLTRQKLLANHTILDSKSVDDLSWTVIDNFINYHLYDLYSTSIVTQTNENKCFIVSLNTTFPFFKHLWLKEICNSKWNLITAEKLLITFELILNKICNEKDTYEYNETCRTFMHTLFKRLLEPKRIFCMNDREETKCVLHFFFNESSLSEDYQNIRYIFEKNNNYQVAGFLRQIAHLTLITIPLDKISEYLLPKLDQSIMVFDQLIHENHVESKIILESCYYIILFTAILTDVDTLIRSLHRHYFEYIDIMLFYEHVKCSFQDMDDKKMMWMHDTVISLFKRHVRLLNLVYKMLDNVHRHDSYIQWIRQMPTSFKETLCIVMKNNNNIRKMLNILPFIKTTLMHQLDYGYKYKTLSINPKNVKLSAKEEKKMHSDLYRDCYFTLFGS